MRVAVMGTGAVGGYFGARLAAASNDVAFIARGPHLAAMRQQGLTLESPQGNLHIRDALFTDDLSAKSASSILCSSASNPTTLTRPSQN